MRVIRMIIYDGDEEWVMKTISKSFNVGKNCIMGEERTITIVEKENDINLIAKINEQRNKYASDVY